MGRHFQEANNHQREFIPSLTVPIPYNGKRRPNNDSILRLVKMEIGGSGFRLKSVVINHYLTQKISKNVYFCTRKKGFCFFERVKVLKKW